MLHFGSTFVALLLRILRKMYKLKVAKSQAYQHFHAIFAGIF